MINIELLSVAVNVLTLVVMGLIAYQALKTDKGEFFLKKKKQDTEELKTDIEQTRDIKTIEAQVIALSEDFEDHQDIDSKNIENVKKYTDDRIKENLHDIKYHIQKVSDHELKILTLTKDVEKLKDLREKDSDALNELRSDISSIKSSMDSLKQGITEIKNYMYKRNAL